MGEDSGGLLQDGPGKLRLIVLDQLLGLLQIALEATQPFLDVQAQPLCFGMLDRRQLAQRCADAPGIGQPPGFFQPLGVPLLFALGFFQPGGDLKAQVQCLTFQVGAPRCMFDRLPGRLQTAPLQQFGGLGDQAVVKLQQQTPRGAVLAVGAGRQQTHGLDQLPGLDQLAGLPADGRIEQGIEQAHDRFLRVLPPAPL